MSGAPWWVVLASTALGGALGILGTIWNAARERTRAGREEWFRRVQWAQSLTTAENGDVRVAGYRMLDHLFMSTMATPDDRGLLVRLTGHPVLDEAEAGYEQDVDVTQFVEDTDSGKTGEAS